ncbi:enoyl-CoA hydratase/carnithine racemase [Sphingobium sp. OAS761]|uniref:enoyl-CoA hydratase/isomerase family protein n=1 Tax=Sphingobium sp. OAS761 TaxID=2817901 RepID=UPI00209E5969|nr:enoyl-CoA hydratase-related protein [Sphingobium sp. OAS761]MCP1472338.1 enoyl-CoA hydratase/carnithine racemase [Sphingobium sp. OAS761]
MMVSEIEAVMRETRNDVAILTLNDVARLNTLSDEMRAALLAQVEEAMADQDIRVIVITGAGGNFSAGGDMRQMIVSSTPDPTRTRRRLMPLHRMIELVASGPKPVIAAVEGAAFGAGLSLAAVCDFVVAGDGARFGAAFGKIGLASDCGLVWSLPQRVGRTVARDLLFTGRPVLAEEAYRIGIVDRLVPAGTALATALEKAVDYKAVAPLSIAAMKFAFAQGPSSLGEVLALEQQQQPMLSMTADHAEGVAAFREKRPARFTGF